jgi:hypothetical protein
MKPTILLTGSVTEYKALLTDADQPRRADLDGRGALSQRSMVAFCRFFLERCLDQLSYMGSILEPAELLRRIEIYPEEEIRAGRLSKGSFPLLRKLCFLASSNAARPAPSQVIESAWLACRLRN